MVEIHSRAILFDMDGTLVDSTACVEYMWGTWGQRHGISLADILAISHGRLTRDTIREIAPHLDAESEAIALDNAAVTRSEGIVALRGARELIDTLQPNEWAVVTSAPRALAEARLRFAGLPIPQCLIGNEDVRAGKPDPDGYLQAAARLGLAPDDCTVIEDTPAGILAARAARMPVIAIGTTFPESELLGATWVRDFTQISFNPAANH
ncbi:HAD-IA family hydrolase [Occallatibacter riparius]|uniref:HAD-IA family hydrolase n=1 Tax=Occallatibacter riparius TaxID=1002689 RepID=A0A9J7BUZ1_9BACT|nr:HAD-IA family hydrolase [Occallatibacter riparius]UWZ86440.1 HAD-IA family hydrolase [Occallatibacter riparius]